MSSAILHSARLEGDNKIDRCWECCRISRINLFTYSTVPRRRRALSIDSLAASSQRGTLYDGKRSVRWIRQRVPPTELKSSRLLFLAIDWHRCHLSDVRRQRWLRKEKQSARMYLRWLLLLAWLTSTWIITSKSVQRTVKKRMIMLICRSVQSF